MVRRGSDPCGCPSWAGVDPTVRAVAEAMAKRDGYRLPGAAGVLKNFLPLAEVAVAEVRRLDGPDDPIAPIDPLTAPLVDLVSDQSAEAWPDADRGEALVAAETPEVWAVPEEAPRADAPLFLRLVEAGGSPVANDR